MKLNMFLQIGEWNERGVAAGARVEHAVTKLVLPPKVVEGFGYFIAGAALFMEGLADALEAYNATMKRRGGLSVTDVCEQLEPME